MRHRVSIVFSWLVRVSTFFLPDFPLVMRLRGFLYSLAMNSCGRNFQVASSVYFNSLAGMKVGRDVYIAHGTVLIGVEITIGDEVIVGPGCLISGGNHNFGDGSFRFLPSTILPVVIGSCSWVAGNCTIVGGASLPRRSILAAGAVLTKQYLVEDAVYSGVPAKFMKMR